MAVAFWKGAIRNYHYSVFVSSDGVNYEQVTAGKSDMANGENYNIINFAPVKARYVKFVGDGFTGTPSGNNTNILELRILKTE
ncbi:MAG: discoidin domain-containing protein [Clostridiales bacterium]|nr:MAG: discoidin domain-containing protein [Clostridiales bacterium]